ncbi:MAG: PQQ-like beta-propeller repeat protein [Pirellula sp.]|nr:PQQ-like beta-propeller repeat protein [Pirellula sp.]
MKHNLPFISPESQRIVTSKPAIHPGAIKRMVMGLLFLFLLQDIGFSQLMGRVRTKRESDLTRPAREVMSLLQDAEEAIENEQWNSAVVALGSLLGLEGEESEDLGYDFFIAPSKRKEGNVVKGSLFQRVRGIIDKLPADGLKVLEVKYGVEAERLFAEASASADWSVISDLSKKYDFLPVGIDATLLLAERAVRMGDSSSAASLYLRLFSQSRAVEKLGPRLAFSAAVNLASIGDKSAAIEILELLRGNSPASKINWNGKEIAWSSGTDTAALLAQLTEGMPAYQDRIVSRPLTLGGDSRRNANTLASKTLTIRDWHSEIHESDFRKRALAATLKAQLERGEKDSFLIPSRVPIHVGRVAIIPTYDHRILAFDVPTGLFLWECPYTGMPVGYSMDRILTMRSQGTEESFAPDYLVKRVWGETSYGQLSSDGERVFGLCERPSMDVAEQYALGQNARIARPGLELPNNVLQCWSVPEQGKIQWEVGGTASPIEPRLANTFFLGAPQPDGDELYVLGEQNGDVFLFSLDPKSGKLLWQQPLVTNLSGPITDDALLRSVGAIPSIDGNMILCPTVSGHLVAFDRQSKSLAWALKYEVKDSLSLAQAGAFGAVQSGDYSPFDTRSADLTPTISKGVAVYAPVDGLELYAVSVLNGKVLWQISQSEVGPFRYVGGIAGDTVLCVYQNSLVGLDLKTGKMKWNLANLDGGAQVVGRGVRRDQFYYLPTSLQQILEIDILSGKITNTTKHDEPLGNLLFATDRVLSVSPFQLTCYKVKSIVSEEIKNELAQESVSIDALVKKGEVLLSENRIEEALDTLERAYLSDPANPSSWKQLKKAASSALELDFDKFVGRISQYKIDLDDDFNYVSKLIASLESRGRSEEALLKTLDIVEQIANKQTDLGAETELLRISPDLSIQQEHWVATKIEKTTEKLGDLGKYPNVVQAIDKQLKQLDLLSPASLRKRLTLLRGIPGTELVRNRFAEELLNERRYLDVETLLLEKETAESIEACLTNDPAGRLLLAKVYSSTGREQLAEKLMESLDESAQKELESWKSSLPLTQRFLPRGVPEFSAPSTEIASTDAAKWPKGRVDFTVIRNDPMTLQNSLVRPSPSQAKVGRLIGDAMRGWDFRWGDSGKFLSLFNPEARLGWNIRIPSIGWDRSSPTVYAVDGRIVLESNRTLVGLNGLDEKVSFSELSELWHTSYTPPLQVTRGRTSRGDYLSFWGNRVAERGFAILSVSRRGILVFENDRLEFLDLNNKRVLWNRTNMAGQFFSVHGNNIYAIRPGKEIRILDLRDGQDTQSIPFKNSTNEFFALGKLALFGASESGVARLVDLSSGNVLLERTFSADTIVGVDAEIGLVALDNAGQYHYWSVADQKEYSGRISYDKSALEITQTDRVDQRLSLAKFRDRVVVLPFSSSIKVADLQIFPSLLEDHFAPVSGPVFAISAVDGSLAWKKAVPVVNYSFPILQNRNESPALLLTRRIDLPRINNNNFASMASIAVLDLKSGDLLHMSHDNECARTSTFTQTIFSNETRMLVGFAASQFSLRWTGEEAVREQPISVGNLNAEEYRKSIKEMFEKMRTEADSARDPLSVPPPAAK